MPSNSGPSSRAPRARRLPCSWEEQGGAGPSVSRSQNPPAASGRAVHAMISMWGIFPHGARDARGRAAGVSAGGWRGLQPPVKGRRRGRGEAGARARESAECAWKGATFPRRDARVGGRGGVLQRYLSFLRPPGCHLQEGGVVPGARAGRRAARKTMPFSPILCHRMAAFSRRNCRAVRHRLALIALRKSSAWSPRKLRARNWGPICSPWRPLSLSKAHVIDPTSRL